MYQYEIIGQIAGPIWQPGFDDCRKDISERFTRVVDPIHKKNEAMDLQEMLEKITNDGDFQYCKMTGDSFLRVTRITRGRQRKNDLAWTTTHEHTYNLVDIPSAAEFVDAKKVMQADEW